MGNCFSSKSQGQVLGSGPPSATGPSGGHTPAPAGSSPVSARPSAGHAIGGSGNPDDPRAAALRAAEARAQAADKRGVSASNAKAGQLSQKLAMERRTSGAAVQTKGNPNERMMDAGQWN